MNPQKDLWSVFKVYLNVGKAYKFISIIRFLFLTFSSNIFAEPFIVFLE